MSLQAQIQFPGLISLAYPYQGQSITSHVRLAGNVIVPPKDKLPQGTDFIAKQLSEADQALLLPSHQLFGKSYLIKDLTYYMDGTAVRQVDYVSDEIRTYNFNDDYLSIFYGEQIAEGDHTFAIVVTAYSPQNPGITLYDTMDLKFFFSTDTNSIKGMLDAITPKPFLGGTDHQILMFALDYVLTQRTEGALKNDIDFLGTLYDVDRVPAHLLPFLAKTIGYDYFAGLLGSGDSIREELRFLPDWQKSVGTKESILVLLRALSLDGKIVPLYLDLNNHTLITGAKQRYGASDVTKIPAMTRQSRVTIPLTHDNFVPQSIKCDITNDAGNILAAFVWDIVLNEVVWQSFSNSGWLVSGNNTPATLANVTAVYADQARGGITIAYDAALKLTGQITVTTTYLYEVDTKPGRNTRLSEFFDVVLTSTEAPNNLSVKDYLHATDIIRRSKPFRTKVRHTTLPSKQADAFVINAGTASSTNLTSNPDRLSQHNIPVSSTNLRGVIEEVGYKQIGNFSDGFLFSWEVDCNQFENRFGLFYSLALDVTLHGQETRDLIASDTLVQRGYAAMVGDDQGNVGGDRQRWLRPIGSELYNFTYAPACFEGVNHLAHYHTIRHAAMYSPAIQTYSDLLIEIDTHPSPANAVTLILDILETGGHRTGTSFVWDGASGLTLIDHASGAVTPSSFDFDSAYAKGISGSVGGVAYSLFLFQPTIPADIEAIWHSRPNLRNQTFEMGKWYAIWDLEADFYVSPVHLSVHFTTVSLNHQGTCCGCDLGTFTTGSGVNFNQILGKTYQFGYEFDVEVYSTQTNEVFASYRWTSGAWRTLLANPSLAVTLSPANTGSLTANLIVAGSAAYVGAIVSGIGQEWAIRACPRKVGDRMSLKVTTAFTEDFGAALTHNGLLGVLDDEQTFLGLGWRDLIEHKHDLGGQRLAAFDGYYLRQGELRSCLTYKVTRATDEFVWDSGQLWDSSHVWDYAIQFQWDVSLWDTAVKWDPETPPRDLSTMTIHHFPKRQVFEFA